MIIISNTKYYRNSCSHLSLNHRSHWVKSKRKCQKKTRGTGLELRQTSSLRLSSAEFREKFCPLFLPTVGAGWNYASNPKREAKKQGVRNAYPLLFGSPCWTRTSDTLGINKIDASVNFAYFSYVA